MAATAGVRLCCAGYVRRRGYACRAAQASASQTVTSVGGELVAKDM